MLKLTSSLAYNVFGFKRAKSPVQTLTGLAAALLRYARIERGKFATDRFFVQYGQSLRTTPSRTGEGLKVLDRVSHPRPRCHASTAAIAFPTRAHVLVLYFALIFLGCFNLFYVFVMRPR